MGCKNCNDPCKKTVIDSKGEKGDKGPQGEKGDTGADGADGADGLSTLIIKEDVEKKPLAPTGTDGPINAMIGDGVFYIDVPEGEWILEFSALLGSDDNTLNKLFSYQIFEDADQSHTSSDSGDTALGVSERKEIVYDPDLNEHHSIYTTARVSFEGGARRYKVYYGYESGNEGVDEYFTNNMTLRAIKFQDVQVQ